MPSIQSDSSSFVFLMWKVLIASPFACQSSDAAACKRSSDPTTDRYAAPPLAPSGEWGWIWIWLTGEVKLMLKLSGRIAWTHSLHFLHFKGEWSFHPIASRQTEIWATEKQRGKHELSKQTCGRFHRTFWCAQCFAQDLGSILMSSMCFAVCRLHRQYTKHM